MKTSRAYFGHNSQGVSVDVAQAINGKWYRRYYEFNGYAVAAGKWTLIDAPSFRTSATNAYTGEVTTITDENQICEGFCYLNIFSKTPAFRLPE